LFYTLLAQTATPAEHRPAIAEPAALPDLTPFRFAREAIFRGLSKGQWMRAAPTLIGATI